MGIEHKALRHKKAAHKHVKIKAHHAKPYRKRHVGLLVFSIAALLVLGAVLVSYRDRVVGGLASSHGFVSDLFSQNTAASSTIVSSYGFNLTYDQKKFYASAIDASTGDLHLGSELSQERAYSVVRVAPSFTGESTSGSTKSAVTFTYHPEIYSTKTSLEATALKDGGLSADTLSKLTTSTVFVGGKSFQKTTWQAKNTNILSPSLSAKFETYVGVIQNHAFSIVLNLGIGDGDDSEFADIVSSLLFSTKVSAAKTLSTAVAATTAQSRTILDTLTNTDVAAAAVNGVDLTGSEKVAALYSPAVAKIYNAYCMDIALDGKVLFKDACSAASGSGFYVSQDGYMGTNGHVATALPIDIAITNAFTYYTQKGDASYLNLLANAAGVKQSDATGKTDEQFLGYIVDQMYKLDTRIAATNSVDNLLVQTTAKNPDVAALLKDTNNREEYTNTSVTKAKLVASDYREVDGSGFNGFKASDVAIIKVEGTDYPVVKLGSIDSVTLGSDLSILGYPSNASDNGIVDTASSEVTLTTGKVSSKKNALNSDKKLIETDTTIGHGNSGGPALDDDGEVVGIATYTSDGSGTGDGVFNYIRDIKDFTDLAAANSITFDTNSATQEAWQSGIENFYASHYSKALSYFTQVEKLYPNDSRVAEFTAAAQKRIDNGEDVAEFTLWPVLIASAVIFVGIITGIVLIIRHSRKHAIYMAGLAQGTIVPVGKGVKTQKVFVSKTGPIVDTPLVLSTAPASAASQQSVAPAGVVPTTATASPRQDEVTQK